LLSSALDWPDEPEDDLPCAPLANSAASFLENFLGNCSGPSAPSGVEVPRLAAQHLLLQRCSEFEYCCALLLREFFLAGGQLIELLKRLVDVLVALAGRTGGLRRSY